MIFERENALANSTGSTKIRIQSYQHHHYSDRFLRD